MTPWRRCRPGSGATRSEPVFPTKREGPARGRRRHTMVAEALAPSGAARVATVYTNAPKRRREAISTDLCTLLRPHVCPQQPNSVHKRPNPVRRGRFRRFVYTPASPRLLATAQQCTQTPQSGAERPDPPICVHYCDPKATHNPSPRRNSVHKRPETAPRGHFHRFVYTPALPPGGEAHHAGVVTQSPTHTNSRSLNDQPD